MECHTLSLVGKHWSVITALIGIIRRKLYIGRLVDKYIFNQQLSSQYSYALHSCCVGRHAYCLCSQFYIWILIFLRLVKSIELKANCKDALMNCWLFILGVLQLCKQNIEKSYTKIEIAGGGWLLHFAIRAATNTWNEYSNIMI